MSIEAINWALDLNLQPSQKLVVIVLANYADANGLCWPSFETLSRKTCLTRRSVIQQIAKLEEIGALQKVQKRFRQQNVYRLNLLTSEFNSPVEEVGKKRLVNDVHHTSEPHSLELVNDVHPNHYITIREPSSLLSTVPVDPMLGVEFMDQNLSLLNRQKNEELRKQVQEVISFLNEKTGKAYRTGKSNFRLVSGRLKEGATTAQCKQIIVRKARKWLGDPKMEDYLRPKTLFNATNFEQYLGELVVPKENEICT